MTTTTTDSPSQTRRVSAIQTTLYDLIATLNAEVDPEEEGLVVATVVHLLGTGQITFLDPEAYRN